MADLPFSDVMNIINTQYPDALPILQQPGVFQVYWDYVQSKQGTSPWSDAQLQSNLRSTPYYQQTDQTQRSWDILRATDPATAQQKIQQTSTQLEQLQSQTGVWFSNAQQFSDFVQKAVGEGWTTDQLKYNLLTSNQSQYANSGEVANNAAQVQSLAHQYAVPLSDQAALQWAMQLSEGAVTGDTIKGYLVEQAKSLFPGLGAALDSGQTVDQYADPYKQIAVQQLGINPGDIDWSDPKWGKALNQVDPKTGARVSQSLDQWMSTIRTDPSFGYDQTSNAKQSASQLASQLQQKFGAQ